MRLLSLHNLVYTAELAAGARRAIVERRFDSYRRDILAGAAPWDAAASP